MRQRYISARMERYAAPQAPEALHLPWKDHKEPLLDYRELVSAIDGFLDTLSPEKRSIFICRYWYDDSV